MPTSSAHFRRLCTERGIAVTHQRQVLYETMREMKGHPSPEEVHERMRTTIPSVSLATVYKNIHLFVASGVFRQMSVHHGTLRVEMNREEHHHMVCSICRSITDVEASEIDVRLPENRLPGGFRVERCSVDIIGVCAACQAAGKNTMPAQTTVTELRPSH
ncbi:MAG: transcriptional repressor [Acidobacteria bacterium]|nr:transcriptional repressor [Acidobacteriota bacterium]